MELHGGNAYWTPSVDFDYVSLERDAPSAEVVMLLLLGQRFDLSSPLRLLNEDVLRTIIECA